MIPLDNLLSPQVLQAMVAGLFVAVGWVVAAAQNRRRDERLRRAREDDLQRALLAEIRAHVVALEQQIPTPEDAARLIAEIRNGTFVPTLPQEANDRIYGALIAEIHLLPAPVIDPVVIYYRLVSVLAALAAELRRVAKRDPMKAARMMDDYLSLTEETRDSGFDAIRVLTACLKGGPEAVEAMLKEDQAALERDIAHRLPGELADLRGGLGPNTRAWDRSVR